MIRAKIESTAPVKASVRLVDGIQAGWSVWEVGRSYLPLEKVSRGGSSFICTRVCTAVDPLVDVGEGVEGQYWLLIAKGGQDGKSIESIEEIGRGGITDDSGKTLNWTDYRITYADGKVFDYRLYDGVDGKDGKDGTMRFEELTAEQKAELKGDPGKALTYEDLTEAQKAELRGQAATINGVNALTVQGDDGIDATMSGDTLTIKAKTVEEWAFTLEDDSTVTKKVVLV